MSQVLADLPADFAAAVLVLLHLSPTHTSLLVPILSRRTALRVEPACGGERLEPGVVYVATPDRHLRLGRFDRLQLANTPRVHFVRPSADVLLASLADRCPRRCIAVVLTGGGVDGAEHLARLKACGGTVIAQDEATSQVFGMPRAAIDTGAVDLILPLDGIAPALRRLVAVRGGA